MGIGSAENQMAREKNMKILFVVPCTPYFPSGIVRVEQYFPFLDARGIQYDWFNYQTTRVQSWLEKLDLRSPIWGGGRWGRLAMRASIHASGVPYRIYSLLRLLAVAPQYDLVFINAVLLPAWAVRVLKRRNPHIVFDFDDAVFLRNPRRAEATARNAWFLTPGSHFLFDYARQFNKSVLLLPSAVQLSRYTLPQNDPIVDRPFRIGWIGSPSTMKYLKILEEPLMILKKKAINFELVLIGTRERSDLLPEIPGVSICNIPYYTGEQIPDLVEQFDIGVMPMTDGSWERGKCAMKAIIYMAGAKPALCSPVGENTYVIQDGVNGFLPASSAEWASRIESLYLNPAYLHEIGLEGRKTVERSYSDEACFELLFGEVLSKIPGKE
jgi:glycosyltransferase involved in cell wall biosynthesis